MLRAMLLMMLTLLLLAAGCNTVEGMGKDIERTGQAIQNAVE